MSNEMKAMVDRFLQWPLPKSVCSDLCVTDPKYPYSRVGTNLLTAPEAQQMLEYVLSAAPQSSDGWIPQEVYEALLAWTGAEPSQSILARAMNEWLGVEESPPEKDKP